MGDTEVLSEEPLVSAPRDEVDEHEREERAFSVNSLTTDLRPSGWLTRAAACVLVTNLFERLAFFTIQDNLDRFLINELNYTNTGAFTCHMIFVGMSSCLALFGGLVADTLTGHYWTICFGFGLYIIGSILMEIAAVSKQVATQQNLIMSAMVFVVLGKSGLNAVLPVYGADQVHSRVKKRDFLHWFYFFRNVGDALANVVAGLAFGLLLPDTHQLWRFLPTILSVALAFISFLVGSKYYMGSNVRLKESWKVISVVCSCCPITSRIRSGSRRMSLGVNVKSIKKAIAEKKKRVRRMVQILLVNSSVFGFGILYSQMLTTYEFQARGMDRMINGNVTLPIPETCMLAFNELAILVFIPILVKCIYPCIENRGRSTGYFTRMGFGMVCAALSGLYGIILEVSRQQSCHQFDGVPKLSGLWQGPEYAIIGLGETLTFIAAMEYSYLEAPTGLRGTAMGLFNLGFGLSYCVALIVVTIVDKLTDWYTVDLKDTCLTHNIGHLERYLLLLLGFLALCAISFVIVAFYLSSQKRKSAATTSTS